MGGPNHQESRDSKAVVRAMDELGGSRRARLRGRAIQVGDSAEPLACPSCKKAFDYGDLCPDCDVRLVGFSSLGSVEPESLPHVQARAAEIKSILAIIAVLVMIVGSLFYGGTSCGN